MVWSFRLHPACDCPVSRRGRSRMVVNKISEKKRRRAYGSSLAEFGPALFIALFFGVFVMVDLIGLGYGYCTVQSLNDLQLREAAKLPRKLAEDPNGIVCKSVPEQWKDTVMGGVACIESFPETGVSYPEDSKVPMVTVATTVQVRPILTIPIFPKVPGLGAPVTFTITNCRILEY
ncbi:MAG: hypothetical protein K2Z81_06115 [Cyanobacteria bacterium]|nr:hypothetical protein [Cyanobacteriota bacterium]